jgi:lysophospholipase L1-like esterase
VGDSCTYGTGLCHSDTYPEQLKRLLAGQRRAFHVCNFGKSGATAGATLGKFKTYSGTSACDRARAFAAHTYVVMLGTNDADNCEPQATEAGLTALVQLLKGQHSVVVLVLPPGVKGGRMKSNFAAVVHPAVRQVAADCGVELIEPDLFASKEMYQADNVHLSREGASCLAQAVASCLLQTQDNISTT